MLRKYKGNEMALKSLTKRYRISLEDSQDACLADRVFREQIKGRHGIVYLWDDNSIAIETEKIRFQNKLAEIPWLKRQSWCVFICNNNMISDACKLIKAYLRRQISLEQSQKLSERGRQALKTYRDQCTK